MKLLPEQLKNLNIERYETQKIYQGTPVPYKDDSDSRGFLCNSNVTLECAHSRNIQRAGSKLLASRRTAPSFKNIIRHNGARIRQKAPSLPR